jgi:Domain of unknown function (DUF1857)
VTRDDLWRGLVAKAGNALPFVAAMSRCEVLEQNVFDRSISFRGQANWEATMSDWITDYYVDVDAMRLQSYVDRHTDDAQVVFGNTTRGGAAVTVPTVSVLDRAADGRVCSLRIHIDLAPLFERIGAEASPQDVSS